MGVVDFAQWAVPPLEVRLGGVTYMVPPPSVARARHLLALAAQSEIFLGLVKAEMPQDLQDVVDSLKDEPLADVTLTPEIHKKMVENGLPAMTIDRVAYYALHYWARGKPRADALAALFWSPVTPEEAPPGEA